MKIFLISPNISTLLTDDQLATIRSAGDLTVVDQSKPLKEVSELYDGDEPRIVAIDPDFCEWVFPNDVIDAIPNLKAIVLQTTSFSWIDADHCKEKGIPVMNLRGFSTVAVAEWLTFLVLAVARRVPVLIQDNWQVDYQKHRGLELRGKKAGVIGLGRIGTAVAENLAGLGMDVCYWSRQSEDERFTKLALDELVKTSDVIAVALASNSETAGLITDDMLMSIKPTAVFANAAHPDIYNHDLMLQLAAEGKIGGYAFEDDHNPNSGYKGNVWNGEGLGWCTKESVSKNSEQWVEATVAAAKGEYPTQVNE